MHICLIICENVQTHLSIRFLHTQSMEAEEEPHQIMNPSLTGLFSMGVKKEALHICDKYQKLMWLTQTLNLPKIVTAQFA